MRRFVLLCLFSALFIAGAAGVFAWRALAQPLLVQGDGVLVVSVRPGDGAGRVIDRLSAAGHLRHPRVLRLWARWRGGSLHVGDYELAAGMSARRAIDHLLSGQVLLHGFTIIEGWSFRQLRAALSAEGRLRQEAAALDDLSVMTRLGAQGQHPEGWFAPDTYFFASGADSDLDLLRRALEMQRQRLDQAWSKRAENLPYKTPYELLVMASIVEKETGQAQERPDIAGVFVRRMKIGMRLQTDPTVIYGLGDKYRGNLTRAHLQQPTPWNTYVIGGLPPTPIAMPGAAAIEAAAHPAEGMALYFVGRGDGTHHFSATLGEHNDAVRRYQLQRRGDYHSAPKKP